MENTGFDKLLNIRTKGLHNLTLLSELVKRYDKNQWCFVLNNHNFHFGFEDVLHKPVVGDETNAQIFSTKFLSDRIGSRQTHKKGINVHTTEVNLSTLRNTFMVVPHNIDQTSDEFCRRPKS